jgi:hypothetical protein
MTDNPINGLGAWSRLLEKLIEVLPELKTKIQITGLAIAAGAIIITWAVFHSTDLLIYIAAGGMGLLLVVFGQVFSYLTDIPKLQRTKYILAIYFGLLAFLLLLFSFAAIFVKTIVGERSLLYDRLARISSGSTGPCKASETGAVVQIFEKGWLVMNFGDHKIYAISNKIERGTDPANPVKINWSRYDDAKTDPNDHYAAPCNNLDLAYSKLLEWRFRQLYCDSNDDLPSTLGKPITKEIATWTQFQPTNAGLLIAGVPAEPAQITSGIFVWMSAIFLEFEEMQPTHGEGKSIGFSADDVGSNINCMALWRPAKRNNLVYSDPDATVILPADCSNPIRPREYINGGRLCLLTGRQ